ncbi:MAG: lysylphosphatidylglycerol synthase transmembrane domain-containing protein [Planctomycetota bacterium]|jgi:uncharacterized protein (TIRG00374 family)
MAPETAEPPPNQAPDRGSRIKVALRIAFSLGLFAFVLSRCDWDELTHTASGFRLGWVLLVLGCMLINTLLSTLKWRTFLHADGVDLPVRQLFSTYLVGTFFSCFLPSSIGGDVYRIYHVSKTAGGTKSTAAVLMERALGLVTLVGIGAVAALFGGGVEAVTAIRWVVLALLVALIAALVLVNNARFVRVMAAILGRLHLGKIGRLMTGVAESFAVYRNRSGVMTKVFLLSGAQQFLVILGVFFLAKTLRIDVGLDYFMLFVPLVTIVETLPISIFGIGVRDVSYVYLLGTVGVSAESSVGLSVLLVTLTLIYASSGGLVYATRQLRARREASDSAENSSVTP